jgi:putative lipoprotein|nr:MAG TPA: hypothetical protein [Caudoviricetes sp.]
MFEVANLDLLQKLMRVTFARRTICYVASSQVWTCPAEGWLIVRCLGAGGGGAWAASGGVTGGSAGTVGLKRLRASRGDQYTIAIPAGGAAQSAHGNGNGNSGGTLTVQGPGVSISIPGGPGGVVGSNGAQNPESEDPTGLDWFIKSARNKIMSGSFYGGGAAPALLIGGASHAATSQAGASVSGTDYPLFGNPPSSNSDAATDPQDASHCWLLVDVSGARAQRDSSGGVVARSGVGGAGARYGGFGGGGSGALNAYSAGAGGTGAGGGGCLRSDHSGQGYSGAGGAGFVTLELLEAQP